MATVRIYRDFNTDRKYIGKLKHEARGHAMFQYDESYVRHARANGELGISERLPVAREPYQPNEIEPFFWGLLPEGEVYGNLATLYQVARSDYLTILAQLGCESVGALTLVAEDVDAGEYRPCYEPLGKTAIERLRNSPVREITKSVSETRLSLSGAQSKTAWYLSPGKDAATAGACEWLIPRGTAPSSHIVKFARKGEEELAVNEHACSLLADSCGIQVARTALLEELPGALAVERYDRAPLPESGEITLARLHQEDFCQAIGFPPYFKYQPESGEGEYLIYIADLIDATVEDPAVARMEFAKRLAFNYAVGNTDAHLKNSALLYNATWTARTLAPLYDVTCIPLAGYSAKMPFVIGEHRELGDINEKDLLSIALDLDVGIQDFSDAIREVTDGFGRCADIGADAEVRGMLGRIAENAEPRLRMLERCLG